MSFAILGATLAAALSVIAAAHLLPLLVALSAGDGAGAVAALIAGLLTGFVAGALALASRGTQRQPSTAERLAALALIWFVTPLFGALFLAGSDPSMRFTDAYFEAVSALTTTGAAGVHPGEALAVTAWRATLQWVGGFATLLMMVTVLAPLGLAALSLRRAPAPPGATEGFFGAYWPAMLALGRAWVLITLAGVVALLMTGRNVPEALIAAFSAIATAGMLPRPGGTLVEAGAGAAAVLAVLLLIGSTSFQRHAGLVRQRPRDYWADPEIRYMLIGIAGGGCALGVIMALNTGAAFSLSRGLLWMLSLMSTSVHAVDAQGFAAIPMLVALAVVFVGGSTMSTAGGLKLMRLALLTKQGAREIARLAHPHGIIHTEFAGRPFNMPVMRGVWVMFVLMLLCAVLVGLALSAHGMPFEQAVAAAVGAVSNAGPVLGFAPDADGAALGMRAAEVYAALPAGAKLALCLGMIAGRVEVLALAAVLGAWLKRDF